MESCPLTFTLACTSTRVCTRVHTYTTSRRKIKKEERKTGGKGKFPCSPGWSWTHCVCVYVCMYVQVSKCVNIRVCVCVCSSMALNF